MCTTTRRFFLATGAAGFAAALLAAHQASGAPSSRRVGQQALAPLSLDGWEVTAVEVTFPPRDASTRHSHPGFVLGYVLEGSYRFALDDREEVVLSAGEMFYEPPGSVHAVSANASATATTRILAFVFTPAGAAVSEPA